MATTPLAALPAGQIAGVAGTGVFWINATGTADANGDCIAAPSGAGKRPFGVQTTSTQPLIIGKLGGTPGTTEIAVYYTDTTTINFKFPSASVLTFADVTGAPGLALLDGSGNEYLYAGFSADVHGISIPGSAGYGYLFGSSTYAGTPDAGIFRIATKVVGSGSGTGTATGGWFQDVGQQCLDANFTNATNSLANTNLTWALQASRTYSIKMKLSGGNSTATEGAQFALTASNSLTATRFDLVALPPIGTTTLTTARVTSLGAAIVATTFTATTDIWLIGEIKVGVAGTLTLQAAENSAHVSGTLTLNAGSWVEIKDCVAV